MNITHTPTTTRWRQSH